MSTPNIGLLVEERIIRSIAMNLEDANEASIRYAEAIGMTHEDILRGSDPDDLERILERIYAEPYEDRRDGILGLLPKLRNMRSHSVGIAILDMLAVAPEDLAFLSSWTGESVTLDLPDRVSVGLYWVESDNRSSISFHVGNDLTWEHMDYDRSEMTISCPLPDTIRPSLSGMRLRDVVAHPVLDRIDLVIESWEDVADDILFRISPISRKIAGVTPRPAEQHSRLILAPDAPTGGIRDEGLHEAEKP